MRKLFLLALLLPLGMTTALAETMFIQSKQAKLLSAPNFKSKPIMTLEKATQVEVINKKGRWTEIEFNTERGWVSSFILSKSPPLNRVTILKGDNVDLSKSARKRASAVTTAGAARGLAANDRMRNSDLQQTDYKALEMVEKLSVTDEEVDEFISSGAKQ